MTNMPVLERSGDHVRLLVDGEPFLCLGGELHNSSSSDATHMAPIWESLGRSGVSSVVASVGWDQVEPEEGRFDFGVVDDLLNGARSAGVRLVLIWFGAFKNALSTYAPTWVRADRARFPARTAVRRRTRHLSAMKGPCPGRRCRSSHRSFARQTCVPMAP